MRHQRQGTDYDCLPTTMAMLADVDRLTVLRVAELRTGRPWSRLVGTSDFWPTARYLADLLMLPLPIDAMREGDCMTGDMLASERVAHSKGTIVVRHRGGTRHIVAFEDGLVYDPISLRPQDFSSWLADRTWHEWEIERIDTLPETSETERE